MSVFFSGCQIYLFFCWENGKSSWEKWTTKQNKFPYLPPPPVFFLGFHLSLYTVHTYIEPTQSTQLKRKQAFVLPSLSKESRRRPWSESEGRMNLTGPEDPKDTGSFCPFSLTNCPRVAPQICQYATNLEGDQKGLGAFLRWDGCGQWRTRWCAADRLTVPDWVLLSVLEKESDLWAGAFICSRRSRAGSGVKSPQCPWWSLHGDMS